MRVNIYSLIDECKLVKEKGCNISVDSATQPSQIKSILDETVYLSHKAEEYIYMLAFNSNMKILGVFEISHGIVNAAICSPREIFIRALLCGATYIIITHNHPSGDMAPSLKDIDVTKRIQSAGEIINIHLLDHIIVTPNGYFSMKESETVEF